MTAAHWALTGSAVLLAFAPASASARTAGERAYQKCYSCHATERGNNGLEGPTLHRIVGRRVAAERGVEYSRALRAYAAKQPRWTVRLLDRYIADPNKAVPRTRMNFPGMRDAKERRALLQYLKSLR